MQFGQNKMEDCVATCRDVCARATHHNSGNWPFLQTKAFYIISAVYRQAKQFDLANEYMENSTEVLKNKEYILDPSFLLYAIRTRRLWEFYRVVRERFDMSNCRSKNSKNINKA